MKMINSLFKCKLDERQLKIRGNIYFRSFSILSFIIVGLFFAKEIFNIDLMVGDWEYLIALFIGLGYCFILMIYHEIYPLTSPKYRLLFILFGIYGFGYFSWYTYLALQGRSLVENNQLTIISCEMIFTLFHIIIFITYVIKVTYNHYHLDDDN